MVFMLENISASKTVRELEIHDTTRICLRPVDHVQLTIVITEIRHEFVIPTV